LSTYLGSYTDL